MNILYLDTSQNILIAGVLKGAENFPRTVDAGKSGHTRILMGEIDAALKAAGLDISDIDAVAAVMGPGSFTGIRIGAATAAALTRGTGAKKIAVTEFELIAYHRGRVTAAVEAGRGNLYCRRVRGTGASSRTRFIPSEESARWATPFLFEPLRRDRAATLGRDRCRQGGRGGKFADCVRALLYAQSRRRRGRQDEV